MGVKEDTDVVEDDGVEKSQKYIEVSQENIGEIIDRFHEDLPDEAIIKQEKFGMVFRGYRIGWTIDRLNEIIGPHQWNLIVRKQSVAQTKKGAFKATVMVGLAIGPPKGFEKECSNGWSNSEYWSELTVVPMIYKEAYGDSVNPSKGDSLKGAVSDATKKALSMVGIGVKAYKGLIGEVEEDIGYIDEEGTKGETDVPW